MAGLKFTGVVYFRSSLPGAKGPVGEAAILGLNPQRKDKIIALTGWPRLEPGSLNLAVPDGVLSDLMRLRAAWTEDAATVNYPQSQSHIPKLRVAYHYFLATAYANGKNQEVLVRRAQNPLSGVVELLAPEKLTVFFSVDAGDQVKVETHAI